MGLGGLGPQECSTTLLAISISQPITLGDFIKALLRHRERLLDVGLRESLGLRHDRLRRLVGGNLMWLWDRQVPPEACVLVLEASMTCKEYIFLLLVCRFCHRARLAP